MKKSAASQGQSASELIDKRIAELGDWRGETLSRMRKLIQEADPDIVEEWKWRGTPVWSHDGISAPASLTNRQRPERDRQTVRWIKFVTLDRLPPHPHPLPRRRGRG